MRRRNERALPPLTGHVECKIEKVKNKLLTLGRLPKPFLLTLLLLCDIVVVSRRHQSQLRNKKKSSESVGHNCDAALELAGKEAEVLKECTTTMCSQQSDTSVPPILANSAKFLYFMTRYKILTLLYSLGFSVAANTRSFFSASCST